MCLLYIGPDFHCHSKNLCFLVKVGKELTQKRVCFTQVFVVIRALWFPIVAPGMFCIPKTIILKHS